jgi:hypothetical protein
MRTQRTRVLRSQLIVLVNGAHELVILDSYQWIALRDGWLISPSLPYKLPVRVRYVHYIFTLVSVIIKAFCEVFPAESFLFQIPPSRRTIERLPDRVFADPRRNILHLPEAHYRAGQFLCGNTLLALSQVLSHGGSRSFVQQLVETLRESCNAGRYITRDR